MSSEIEITDANFDNEVIKSSKPVMLDVWAPWCGPCRMLGPVVEELANEYSGKVKVGKLNTDDNSATASKYNVSAIPTILFFKGGKVMNQVVGVQSKADLKKHLDELI